MFATGFHRLTFFFTLAASVVWFFILRAWVGTILAAIFFVPVGIIFSFLPSMLTGSLRHVSFLNDFVLTWAPIVAGIGLFTYGLVAFHGATAALIALCGAALVFAGVSLLQLRLMAMRIRHGEATKQDVDFVDDIYDVPR